MNRAANSINSNSSQVTGWSRDEMAERAAQDIPDGAYVNLGIGLPEKIALFVPSGREVIYHTENGLLGMGGEPSPEEHDRELINAGKKAITAIPGAAFFHHSDSFAMIRGGHIDICALGALQVSADGDLANWSTGSEGAVPAVGGAMDLVAGVKTILVITQHCTKNGEPKLVESCTYPLTGRSVVSRIYTDLAVIDVSARGFSLVELAPGISIDEVRAKTDATIYS